MHMLVVAVALVVGAGAHGVLPAGVSFKTSAIDARPEGATAWLPNWNYTGNLAAADWSQCGESYSGNTLGTCTGTSICNAGCAICSTNDYLTYLKYTGNPGDLNTYMTKNGGYADGCSEVWSVADTLGFTVYCGTQTPDYATVCNSVNNGNGIIAWVNNQSHFVLVVGCDGKNNYYTNDPYYANPLYAHSSVASFRVYHPKATGCY
eukprot:TRINITY_DN16_c0_g2_i1.p1 TRINITY_DN16_c0_g2~~TRINITY_DN16_c0_g2_i1.p1  ORF type:complete len:206 (-),score=20.43 TRINITY_DN16_c0_g2_i1:93-710(-)